MRIPKSIREKFEQRKKLKEEIEDWFKEQDIDLDGMFIDEAYICNPEKVTGKLQRDGEFCDQVVIGEDSYSGTYYWECDNGQYLAIYFYM